jgi:hypothetical protein
MRLVKMLSGYFMRCPAAKNIGNYWRNRMAEYKDYTNEEYDALDEYYTKNTIMPSGKPGLLTRRKRAKIIALDHLTTTYIEAKAEAAHLTPSEVLTEMVRHEMAYA